MARHPYLKATLAALAASTLLFGGVAIADPGDIDGTYQNYVGEDQNDAFSDPSIIRGKDGYWYAYASQTVMLKENQGGSHVMPMMRSEDLVDWEYIGDVFTEANAPTWKPWEGSLFWAPDVRYVNGKYYLYYSLNRPGVGQSIGLATADSPAGPWTDIGHPVVDINDGTNEIDSALYQDHDGQFYLYYGSFGNGGIKVVKLNDDGTEAVSEPQRVVAPSRGEAPYVVERDGWYYLFYSGLGCCDGAQGAYQVFVGRSRSPLGPFLDREGVDLNALHPGGTLVLSTNGNRWVSVGHSANFTDASGQTWMVNNGLDRTTPEWGGRPTMMDRLDWFEGWPTVRAGHWQSDEVVEAPASWTVGTVGEEDKPEGFTKRGSGAWRLDHESDAGGYFTAHSSSPNPLFLLTSEEVDSNIRAEADVRIAGPGRVGMTVAFSDARNHVSAWLDPAQRALVIETTVDGSVVDTKRAELYEAFDFSSWKSLVAEVRDGVARVQVSHADQGNPLGTVEVGIPDDMGHLAGVVSVHGAGEVDNVGVTELYEPATEAKPEPRSGEVMAPYSDEFDGTELDEAWSWYQEPDGQQEGGTYVWPTQDADFRGVPEMASAMLREAPTGNYIVETKLHLPITEAPNTSAQAGLIAFSDPEHLIRVSPLRVGNSRQVMLWIGRDANPWPEMQGGPSADTMWLRLRHTVHPDTGEHLFQMGTSRDGESWWWGGIWHLPAGQEPKIGLQSMGDEGLTATFEYFRVYSDATEEA